MKMRIFKLVAATFAAALSFNVHASYLIHCGGSSVNVKPIHPSGSVVLKIVNRDFSSAEITEIRKAVDDWGRNRLGHTWMNVTWENASPGVEQFHDDIRNNNNLTENAKDEQLAQFHYLNSEAHIYKRGRAPGFFSASGGLITESSSQVNSATYGWVHARTKKPNSSTEYQCTNHNYSPGKQIHWVPGRDIQIRASHELGGSVGAVTNKPLWETPGNVTSKKDINFVTSHEIGHIVGLNHPEEDTGSYTGRPTIMFGSYSQGQNFHDGLGNTMLQPFLKRRTLPLGDDLRGVRQVYQSNTPYRKDVGINQFQVPREWLGFINNTSTPLQLFFNRNSRLWQSYNNSYTGTQPRQYSNPTGINLPWQQNQGWTGFLPFMVHNFGANTESVGGKIYLRKSNGTTSGAWKGNEFTFWVSNVEARGFKVVETVPYTIDHPNPGTYLSDGYRYVLDMIWEPSGDQSSHNDKDVAQPRYTVAGTGN